MVDKNEITTAGIIDSQSARIAQKGAIGYNPGKKIKGRKCHIVADVIGLIITADVHSASIQDRDSDLNLFAHA